jgi:hypothetical protein
MVEPLGHALFFLAGGSREVADWWERFEERAAILEFDGGLPREKAEAKAREIVGPRPRSG